MKVPPAVRILPMNRAVFGGQAIPEVQRTFFSRDLPKRAGRYWFFERGLNTDSGTIVLFQYDNAIIASATLVDVTSFAKPDKNGYRGYFDFEASSIRVFEPVGLAQMREAWPIFSEFSHVRQSLAPIRYQAFLRLTLNGATIAESILRAVGRIAGRKKRSPFSREDVRRAANVDRDWWNLSWNPIFQGMRADHPGGAPTQTEKHQGVFKRVGRGEYVLTAYGRTVVDFGDGEDGRHSIELANVESALDANGEFDPQDQGDERKRKLAQIALRRGQATFRRRLLLAYDGRCAVTGCDAKAALEAAHVLPYVGEKSDFVDNGILLRSDIHTLFDLDLIGIHPRKLTVAISSSLRGTVYQSLAGKKISVPDDSSKQPHPVALKRRWREFVG